LLDCAQYRVAVRKATKTFDDGLMSLREIKVTGKDRFEFRRHAIGQLTKQLYAQSGLQAIQNVPGQMKNTRWMGEVAGQLDSQDLLYTIDAPVNRRRMPEVWRDKYCVASDP
jgi:hypothetical protein